MDMSTLKERLEEALAAAGFPGLITERSENKTRWTQDPNNWYNKPEVPVELEIKLSAVLGDNPEWYSGVLPKWSYDWHSKAILRFVPLPADEPRNECLQNLAKGTRSVFQPYWLRCPPKQLNLETLDMTWYEDKQCISLYQKHRPFREMHEYRDFQYYNDKMIRDVVKSVQALKRIHDLAQPALETINNSITGFRAQIKKVKAKNGLLNEREKAKIKQ